VLDESLGGQVKDTYSKNSLLLSAALDFLRRLIAVARFTREIVIANDIVDLSKKDGS
jgi:hypothetical protein